MNACFYSLKGPCNSGSFFSFGQRAAFALGLLWLSAVSAAPEQSGIAPVVTTASGAVRGEFIADFAVFRGIPYAAAPVGEKRWQPAIAPQPWREVRDATVFGPVCPQQASPGGEFSTADMSEDCLTVNIVTPSLQPAAGLPVMVWVHGGAYVRGSGREALHRVPSGLSRRGVVLVSFNYRVGRFGFFAHPALESEQPGGVGGNYWLSDQVAALQWVHRNISQFGGDPETVTVFGVSAGGSSVNSLAASPAARGLLHRVIAQSGGGFFNAEKSPQQALQRGLDYTASWGFEGEGALLRLRALGMREIIEHESGPPGFGAIIGSSLLPESPSEVFAAGKLPPLAYMAGSTSDEASIFGLMGFSPEVMEQRFGIRLSDLRESYGVRDGLSEAEFLRQVQTDFIFTSGANGMATLAARAGLKSYAYRFTYLPQSERDSLPGVPHGGEVPYVLDSLTSGNAEDRAMAALMQDYWTNFAKTGDPNRQGLPHWPQVRLPEPSTLIIGDPIEARPGFRSRQLDVWYRKWSEERGLIRPDERN